MSLIAWHDRLSTQFRSLQTRRSSEGGGPIFALEHSLTPQEISTLDLDVRGYIRGSSPSEAHWLPWIVYAAELGYQYIGHEYWQTFEADTAGWRERGRGREWIRAKFKKFENDYGGAIPSGPWAEHFNIICHPITHAILPRDFQSQLADVISTIQHLFTVENLADSRLLGQLIESHSSQQRKRFRQFVQDVEMVGLIAQALLGDEENQTSKILTPETLQRIVEDLDAVARDQLQSARQRARITEIRGLSGRRGSRILQPSQKQPAEEISLTPPRVILRRTSATHWEALVEIPDLSPHVAEHPHWRDFIERTRSKANRSATWLSRGKILFGKNLVPLRVCPEPGKSLLTFEDRDRTPSDLESFLQNYFSFPASGILLCQIRADGRAYQSRSLVVRQNREYLVLRTTQTLKSSQMSTPIEIGCQGLFGVRLRVPAALSQEASAVVRSLGLSVVEQLAIFPVGVAAAQWDEDGYGEWVVTDEICIGVKADHWVDGLRLELDDFEHTAIEIALDKSGETAFLQLPPLSIGDYVLSVAGKTNAAQEYERIGDLQIRIREPRNWKTAIAGQGAFIPVLDPPKPSLDEVLRGEVGLEIHGPEGHRVQASISFFEKSYTELIARLNLPYLTLPVSRSESRTYFGNLKHRAELLTAFDSAQSCRIDLRADELGQFSFSFEREFTPLRWVTKNTNGGYLLSLSDDSGAVDKPLIARYDLATPDRRTALNYTQVFENHVVPSSGGLYVATGAGNQYGIMFPNEIKQRIRTFADMGKAIIEPKFRFHRASVENVVDASATFGLWAESRTTGSLLALLARQRVLRAYIAHMFGMIAGPDWQQAEKIYEQNPGQTHAVIRLLDAVTNIARIKRDLQNQSRVMVGLSPKEHSEKLARSFGNLIKRVHATGMVGQFAVVSKSPRWQAEFALRLASAPESLQYTTHDWFLEGIKGLIANQLLARASRFLVLTTSVALQSTDRGQQSSLYAGWDWS
jgi:hypothetical protein